MTRSGARSARVRVHRQMFNVYYNCCRLNMQGCALHLQPCYQSDAWLRRKLQHAGPNPDPKHRKTLTALR